MKNRTSGIVAVVGLAGLMLAVAWQVAQAKEKRIPKSKVPKAVLAAIEKEFPKATIAKTETEDEDGMRVYEFELRHKGTVKDVTVSADGTVMEVETLMAQEALPAAVRKALARAGKGGVVRKTEKAETLAVVRVVKLKKPEVLYEVKVAKGGKQLEIKFAPNGKILEIETEEEEDAKKKGKDDDEETVTLKQVPAAVKATILKEAGANKVLKIEKEREDGRLVYGAEWKCNGREVDLKVAPDGKFLKMEVEAEDYDDDEDEDDDEEDEEEEGETVPLKQVPAAVRATILKEAGKNKILKVEKESEKGRTIYEAKWKSGGKEIEVKVAPNGKLLKKKAKDEDDD